LAVAISAEERRRAAAFPGISYLWQSSAKKNGPMIMLHMTPHHMFSLGLSHTCFMTLCDCCDLHIRILCLFTAWETWKVASSESWGLCQFGQACHRQNCVAVGCPLISAPAESAPCTHRDTTALGEPYAQLFVASAVPVKPDELSSLDYKTNELTSLDFRWMPYGLSLDSHQRHVGFFHALSRFFASPESCCAMLWSSLSLVLLSDKHDKTPFAPSQWT
jgi:hypothetical protein